MVLAALLAASSAMPAMAASEDAPRTFVFTTDGATNKAAPAGTTYVATAQAWNPEAGYGFTSQRDGNEQAFSVRVPEGDYRIRVELDSGDRASRTSLWSEDRRLMLAPIDLKKKQKRTVEFIANTRTPFLNGKSEQDVVNAPKVGLRGDEDISRNWDDVLTISASGVNAAQVRSITIEPVQVRRVFLAGDSTVSDQGGADYASWGQMLPRFLSNDVSVANHARSGETMKSFVTSLRWDKLLSQVREGDIVLIQFAHNDQKKQWPRTYVSAEAGYPAWLKAFAADAQTRGAKVVLISPVARRFFKDGKIENTHGGYDQAVRNVAAELNLPLVDLTQKTTTLYETLGPDVSPLAFAAKGSDKTHHNAYGAWVIANYVAAVITDPAAGLDLKAAPDFVAFDPAKPADPRNYEIKPSDWPLMREVVTSVSGN
ncbi:MAG: rhamnogalacturonan acetylesterase [Asticcacaulis sp.]